MSNENFPSKLSTSLENCILVILKKSSRNQKEKNVLFMYLVGNVVQRNIFHNESKKGKQILFEMIFINNKHKSRRN